MRRIILAIGFALALGGCANIQTAWKVVTEAQVSPQQIIVAANAFDAAEATATQYLIYCKAGGHGTSACTLSTRKKVVSSVRSGRAARNALEPYIVSGGAGPSGIYNTLIAAVSTLQTGTPAVGVQ
jgi:hypothetical protein